MDLCPAPPEEAAMKQELDSDHESRLLKNSPLDARTGT
jgi:hypothetical protein